MTATEFFKRVEKSLKSTMSNDNMGVGFFISDMDSLFNEWDEKKHEYEM